MPLSEIEAHIAGLDYQIRAQLQRIISQKAEITQMLQSENLSVLEEEQFKSMLESLDSAIQQYKVSGLDSVNYNNDM